jgi:hypothetical protein
MSATKLKVGSDIKYFCSRCDLELGHTIVAMVGNEPARVRCNTCRTERNYRQTKRLTKILDGDGPRAPTRMRAKVTEGSSIYQLYQAKIHESAAKTPRNYRIDEDFAVGDVVDHIKFGRGFVLKLIHPDRMEVLFSDEIKVLVKKSAENA